MFSDQASWEKYQQLLKGPAPGLPVALALRELRGRSIFCRPDKDDVKAVFNVFYGRFHLPPEPPRTDGVILDLGANLGYTAAHFVSKYPRCKILSVEMDPDHCQAARRNVGDGANCTVINAAVWIEDGTITYDGVDHEGLSIDQVRSARGESAETAVLQRSAPAKTVETILRENGLSGATIDYVKMDIEGAEYRVLNEKNDWLDQVRTMKVEYHPPATDQTVIDLLKSKGFNAWRDACHWASVTAIRDEGARPA
jgi:FkbM family methyltransferase